MNAFMNKMRDRLTHFMAGRYGADQLNRAMILCALIITLIGAFTGLRILVLAADALLIVAFYRMLSRDAASRVLENQKYMERTQKIRRTVGEQMSRWKNRKQYRYFTCPKCHDRLRVPRGVGNVTITCRKCGEKFDRKA